MYDSLIGVTVRVSEEIEDAKKFVEFFTTAKALFFCSYIIIVSAFETAQQASHNNHVVIRRRQERLVALVQENFERLSKIPFQKSRQDIRVRTGRF